MKTTLVIHDEVMLQAKQQAARENMTLSEFVEGALRRTLAEPRATRAAALALPTFDFGGPPLVDLDHREALYERFDRERTDGLDGLVAEPGGAVSARPSTRPKTAATQRRRAPRS